MNKKILTLISILTCILIGGVSYLILSSNKTTKAVVLKTAVEPGVVITEDMVQSIDIPAATPQGYLRNENSVIGQKSKTRIEVDQLLYSSNFMSSWTNYSDVEKIPEDYVITSISIPDERACGGVITAGDYIDIMAVFTARSDESESWIEQGDIVGRTESGVHVSYILSNVYVLNTNSSLAEAQESDQSVKNNENNSNNNKDPFYVIALSYDDCKKLRQVEGLGDEVVNLWANLCPSQNQVEGNSPLIKQMIGESFSTLHDAQVGVQDKDGKPTTDSIYSQNGGSKGNGGGRQKIEDVSPAETAAPESTPENGEETSETTTE